MGIIKRIFGSLQDYKLEVKVDRDEFEDLCGLVKRYDLTGEELTKDSIKIYEYLIEREEEGYTINCHHEQETIEINLEEIEPLRKGGQKILFLLNPVLYQRILDLTQKGGHLDHCESIRKAQGVYRDLVKRLIDGYDITCNAGDKIIPIDGKKSVSIFASG